MRRIVPYALRFPWPLSVLLATVVEAFFTRAQTGALVSRLNSDIVGARRR